MEDKRDSYPMSSYPPTSHVVDIQPPSQPIVEDDDGGNQVDILGNYMDRTIYLFDRNEISRGSLSKSILDMTNTVYRACFQFWFFFILFAAFIVIPFVGMAAGIYEALLAILWRPFARIGGKLVGEAMGWSQSSYFRYDFIEKRRA